MGILSIGYLCFSLRYLHQKFHKDMMWKFYKAIVIQVMILILCFLSVYLIH